MNQNVQIFVLMLFLMILFGITQSNLVQAADKKPKERLAVLDLEAKYGVDKHLAEALSVIVRDKLHDFGEYEVMSQSDIQAVASREQLKQAIGCDDDGSQCLVDFGRAIGTRFMVAGDISKLGATYTVSLRMLDTKGEGASVKNRVSESCKCDEDALIGTVQDVATKLLGKPTANDTKKKTEEESKKLAEEINNAAASNQKWLIEERRKADGEKQRLVAEVEKLKKEKEHFTIKDEKKRVTSENKPTPVASTASSSSPTGNTHTDLTTGMEFILVPGGCFQMGDTLGDGRSDEKPVHEVCIDAFYMGKYEVTQGQYQTLTGNNPSGFPKGDDYPVETVSWIDAQEFIRSLNSKAGGQYRLPTEAEWEFAARSRGRSEIYAGGNDVKAVAWLDTKSSFPVGQKQSNSLGLHDMAGNVWEWCGDWFDKYYYGKSPRNNPQGPSSGLERVVRGGSWHSLPGNARAASRRNYTPDFADNIIGFRLALPIQRP